jgi:Carboxypeptidase regulatory-like domain
MTITTRERGVERVPQLPCMTPLPMLVVVLAAYVLLPVATLLAQERGPAGTVTLSRTDYDRLLDLASRQPRPPDAAPLPAALTRADISARVDAGAVRATMTVNGEVFQTGSVKVPLISNATLLDARSTDRPLPLVAEGNAHVAVVTGPASFSATLEWGTSITASPGRGSFVLPVPPAGSVRATFDVPGEQSDLRVTPGLVLRRTSAAGRTTVEATLDPGSSTQVWWSSRDTAPAAPPRDARLLSDVKTLVTIGDADLRLLSLVDVTVVQGEPTEFEVRIPAGFEVAGVTGSSLDRSEQQGPRLVLVVSAPSRRRHQFLINLERPSTGGSFKLETGFPTVPAAQRETGEVAVEGLGTLEIFAMDQPGLRRMDVREVDQALSSVARQSLLSAYRYQRSATGVPALALDVTRFPDAAVLAAIAERAVATTLVTSEGRALTEVSLWLRNRAQPFMKVSLPPGASMLSVEVAGVPAKPAEGADGMRVPLLRPGFRPDGPYSVSFVYLHAGPAFAKKGEMQMTLPRMDVPVSVVEWELFVPEQYRADRFAGTAIDANLVGEGVAVPAPSAIPVEGFAMGGFVPGQIVGRVLDAQGHVLPGATIVAEVAGQRQTVVTGADGVYVISNLPPGPLSVTSQLSGFKTAQRSLVYDQRPRQIDFQLALGALEETVTVQAEAPLVDMRSSEISQSYSQVGGSNNNRTRDEVSRRSLEQRAQEPSLNVQSLQRRAAGVLPVRIDVPRAGTSHRFLKPLVVDEETAVQFRYKRR